MNVPPFVAEEPWAADRPETLVICCSDGRWHGQVEQFVRTAVSRRADTYSVPGGPACLVPRNGSALAETAEQALRFLVKEHHLETIWLISHQNCAFYSSRYGAMSPEYAACCQREDMARASTLLRQWHPEVAVRQVHAALNGGRVVFSWLDDESGSPQAAAAVHSNVVQPGGAPTAVQAGANPPNAMLPVATQLGTTRAAQVQPQAVSKSKPPSGAAAAPTATAPGPRMPPVRARTNSPRPQR